MRGSAMSTIFHGTRFSITRRIRLKSCSETWLATYAVDALLSSIEVPVSDVKWHPDIDVLKSELCCSIRP